MGVIKNNDMSGWGIGGKVDSKTTQEEAKKVQPKQDHRKFSLNGGIPQILVTSKKVTMTYKDTGIAVNENGIIMKGKIHLAGDMQDIRLNGFWTLNTELLTCLPSTIYTPMPVLKYSTPPYAETVAKLATLI